MMMMMFAHETFARVVLSVWGVYEHVCRHRPCFLLLSFVSLTVILVMTRSACPEGWVGATYDITDNNMTLGVSLMTAKVYV